MEGAYFDSGKNKSDFVAASIYRGGIEVKQKFFRSNQHCSSNYKKSEIMGRDGGAKEGGK